MPFKRKNASREFIDDSDDPEDTGVRVFILSMQFKTKPGSQYIDATYMHDAN